MGIIITIGLYVKDEIMHVIPDVDGMELECIPMNEGFMDKSGGGKKARDLNEATKLEDRHRDDELCLAPHRLGNVI